VVCEQFVDILIDVHSRDMSDEQIREAATDGSSAVRLLVLTCLSDSSNRACSYREFTARTTASHEAHPVLRLAAWVVYVFRRQGHPVPPLDVLRRLDVIDQVPLQPHFNPILTPF